MTLSLVYELDKDRVMSAVINDSRNTIPAIAGQGGYAILGYIQAQIALVPAGGLVYRIVGDGANLGGYVVLGVQNGVASIILLQLRPAFRQFANQINEFIANFISNNQFLQDVLY